ncbi:ATP-binding protein [Leptolyngbya sp. 15MV]|nr:ATP-binding protein [Leptolyngbya sp. 15MV]
MSERDPLARIAAALERLAGGEAIPETDWRGHPAYAWSSAMVRAVPAIEAPPLDLLLGIEAQKGAVLENLRRHARGAAAHDMFLWGARGMGKSALLRAATAEVQRDKAAALALVQVAGDDLDSLPRLFAALGPVPRRFLVYLDDLGFAEDDLQGARRLRSWLEGGVEARPANVRIAVTSNRRAIVPRNAGEQDDPLNPRDVVDDKLALADRFGIALGFHACDQATYLAIVAAYAGQHGLAWDDHDALEWARRRGARSGRVAWQFVVELAGRAGKAI